MTTPSPTRPHPEVVVFDLGKVLVDFDYDLAVNRITAHSTAPAKEVARLLQHTSLLIRYETGHLSTEQFFLETRDATGFKGSLQEFSAMFSDIFSPMEEMIAFHAKLRTLGIPTYIFSNTNELAVRHIRSHFPFFSGFTRYVFSYEHGAMKPDAPLYEVVERTTGKSGSAILYLDDRPENIATGLQRGWQAIVHKSGPRTLKQISDWGFFSNP